MTLSSLRSITSPGRNETARSVACAVRLEVQRLTLNVYIEPFLPREKDEEIPFCGGTAELAQRDAIMLASDSIDPLGSLWG